MNDVCQITVHIDHFSQLCKMVNTILQSCEKWSENNGPIFYFELQMAIWLAIFDKGRDRWKVFFCTEWPRLSLPSIVSRWR